jgi:hypothetical protein
MRTLTIFLTLLASASAFSVPRRYVALTRRPSILRNSEENSANDSPLTLEEKMKSWEATDEEKRAATLGGLTPGSLDGRLDASHLQMPKLFLTRPPLTWVFLGFDIGLAIAFPFIVGTCALFILFPMYAPGLAGSVEAPPMI